MRRRGNKMAAVEDMRGLQRLNLKDLNEISLADSQKRRHLSFARLVHEIKTQKPTIKQVAAKISRYLNGLVDRVFYETVPVKDVYQGNLHFE